jgi:hypothetical protein
MAKTAQVLSDLNETFFDCEPSVRFDLGVKKFCGSSLAQSSNLRFGGARMFSYGIFCVNA